MVVTAELSFFVENRMASLISGSNGLISLLNLSTSSLYDCHIEESRNHRIYLAIGKDLDENKSYGHT